MGGPPRPKPPDPMKTAQAQMGLNRDAIRDAANYSQIGQQTPWGSVSYSGELGSPERQQTTTLNPQDQQRLDQPAWNPVRIVGVNPWWSGLPAAGAAGAQGAGRGKAGPSQQMPPMQVQKAMTAMGKKPKMSTSGMNDDDYYGE